MRLAIGFLVLALCASSALATPAQDLDKGRKSFQQRDYDSAIPVLNALLYPETRLSRRNDLIEAYQLLGGAFFEIGDLERARREFRAALDLDPDTSLSRLTYSENTIKLFEDVKADVAAKRKALDDARRIADARAAIEAYKNSLVVYEAKWYGTNFYPFGLAQVTQERYLAATVIGVPMTASFATSVIIYGYLVREHGFVNHNLTIPEARRALRLQKIQVGFGIAALALYGISIWDSIRHYKPRLLVEGDDSLIPQELREQPTQPAPPPPRRKLKKVSLFERMRFAPVVTDESVGIGIGWEN